MGINKMRLRIVGMFLLAIFLFAFPVSVGAAGKAGSREAVRKTLLPQTAEEHRAMAKSYRAKAITYKQEAEDHRQMCEEYKFEVAIPSNTNTTGGTGPSLMEMQKKCERYSEDSTDLVDNALELAAYHEAQADALSGQ